MFNKQIIINSIQSGILGIIIGGIFALFRFKPPSPDNLPGILGIVGIYLGWIIVEQLFK